MPSHLLLIILGFFLSLQNAVGFYWNTALPQQCSNITVVVSGTDFVFPFKVLIVPVGPSPLGYEVRQVMEVDFPANTTTVSFKLPYPTGSKFVALVSDGSGYHAGSTGSTLTVLSSADASCFDSTKAAVSPFIFSLSPTNITECRDVRIYWDSASVQGTPSFLAVIPEGGFAPIAPGKIDTQAGLGTGFSWKPAVRAGTNLTIVGGDNRGMGAGGFISSSVGPGDPTRDVSGACPTSRAPDSPLNIGAIAGGVVGGAFLLAVLIVIFYRLPRRKTQDLKLESPTLRFQRPALNISGDYNPDTSGRPPFTLVQPPPTDIRVVAPPEQRHPVEETSLLGQPPPYTADDPSVYIPDGSNTSASSGSWKRHQAQTGASLDYAIHNMQWDGRSHMS